MSTLNVWLDGKHIAVLTEKRSKMALQYVGVDGENVGRPLISVALPVRTAPHNDKVTRPYFAGLLPEGQARMIIAYDAKLDAGDDMGLLDRLGRDCAGALEILPTDESPGSLPGAPTGGPLTDSDIEQRIIDLPIHPLGITGKVRTSLPGMQSKLLLTRTADGWFAPADGAPSTHLLKPAVSALPGSVPNEAFCMSLAALAGLRAAATTVATFGATPTLMSERYDRWIGDDGRINRIHQEDSCQALSIRTVVPDQKYERFGGPTLLRVAGLLDRWGGSKVELLQQIAFSVMVGNADHHGKNVSLLHDLGDTVQLTPLYDVMCTTLYDGRAGFQRVDTELGLFINGKTDIDNIDVDDLVAEAKRWGVREGDARDVVAELAGRVVDAIPLASAAVAVDVPSALVDVIDERMKRFRIS